MATANPRWDSEDRVPRRVVAARSWRVALDRSMFDKEETGTNITRGRLDASSDKVNDAVL